MIKVCAMGRFGNQLFQFAFGYAAARHLQTNFFMPTTAIPDYFTLSSYTPPSPEEVAAFEATIQSVRLDPHLCSTPDRACSIGQYLAQGKEHFSYDEKTLLAVKENYHPDDLRQQLSDQTVYFGYFQSELYFEAYSTEIRRLFDIKPDIIHQVQQDNAPWLQGKKTIMVHVRRGDYVTHYKPSNNQPAALPYQFYRDCLARIPNVADYHILFMSDEIEDVQREFSDLKNASFSPGSEIHDFTLLTLADILILSSSSFSWWGAYLNTREQLQVYAPQYWLGAPMRTYYPPHIAVPGWQEVPVPILKPSED